MEELTDIQKVRREKLNQIREIGINPFPFSFKREDFAADIIKNFDPDAKKRLKSQAGLWRFVNMVKLLFVI